MKNETFAMKAGLNEAEIFHISEQSVRLPCVEKDAWLRKDTFDLPRNCGWPCLKTNTHLRCWHANVISAAPIESGKANLYRLLLRASSNIQLQLVCSQRLGRYPRAPTSASRFQPSHLLQLDHWLQRLAAPALEVKFIHLFCKQLQFVQGDLQLCLGLVTLCEPFISVELGSAQLRFKDSTEVPPDCVGNALLVKTFMSGDIRRNGVELGFAYNDLRSWVCEIHHLMVAYHLNLFHIHHACLYNANYSSCKTSFSRYKYFCAATRS